MLCLFRFLAAALAATGCLCFATAQPGDDPFALLFPDEGQPDVSRDIRVGTDNLQLISMSLRGRQLLEATPAFSIENDLCLPLTVIAEALRFPIDFHEGPNIASGWFVSENRNLRIDFETGEFQFNGRPNRLPEGASLATNLGWCLSLTTLSDLFPVDFDYNQRTLTIEARPREVLPVEARLEREAR
ncbi:MAG: hypothetical protein AAFV54_08145, partial [Pseudomonadota bacterium]